MLWTKAIKHNDAPYKISVEQLKIKEDAIGCCLIVIIQDIIIDVPSCTSYYVLINLMTVHAPVYPLSERFCTLVLKRCVDSFLFPDHHILSAITKSTNAVLQLHDDS